MSTQSKRNWNTSRATVAVPLLREFLDKHYPITTESKNSEISLIDTCDKRIFLNDTEKDTILVQIDENLKI